MQAGWLFRRIPPEIACCKLTKHGPPVTMRSLLVRAGNTFVQPGLRKLTMQVSNFDPAIGQHCETTATGTLLRHIGLNYSEPMLFGLGQGLSFLFWNMKSMEMPFLGGRIKPDLVTQNLCRNLNLTLHIQETTSPKKAWANVQNLLENDQPVGLKLDCFHLDYFSVSFHFAAHYVAMYGHDDTSAFLIDTEQQGGKVQTTLESLTLARSERGPMSSRNLSYHITQDEKPPSLESAIVSSVHANAVDYLNPPISNVSYRGMLKTSRFLKKWFRESDNREHEFQTTAMLMERAGTGGALFRNFYRDFLAEAYEATGKDYFNNASQSFATIANLWTELSSELQAAGTSGNEQHIETASQLLLQLSEIEKSAMEALRDSTAA